MLTLFTREGGIDDAATIAPAFVHVEANSTADTIDLARHAQSIGAAATPYFFGLSQQALMACYGDVARSVGPDFPICVYNIPGCAVNDLADETVLRLSAVQALSRALGAAR
jgi:dihydrodipicolinate synthase/N-acetylneuraminate lyase